MAQLFLYIVLLMYRFQNKDNLFEVVTPGRTFLIQVIFSLH